MSVRCILAYSGIGRVSSEREQAPSGHGIAPAARKPALGPCRWSTELNIGTGAGPQTGSIRGNLYGATDCVRCPGRGPGPEGRGPARYINFRARKFVYQTGPGPLRARPPYWYWSTLYGSAVFRPGWAGKRSSIDDFGSLLRLAECSP